MMAVASVATRVCGGGAGSQSVSSKFLPDRVRSFVTQRPKRFASRRRREREAAAAAASTSHVTVEETPQSRRRQYHDHHKNQQEYKHHHHLRIDNRILGCSSVVAAASTSFPLSSLMSRTWVNSFFATNTAATTTTSQLSSIHPTNTTENKNGLSMMGTTFAKTENGASTMLVLLSSFAAAAAFHSASLEQYSQMEGDNHTLTAPPSSSSPSFACNRPANIPESWSPKTANDDKTTAATARWDAANAPSPPDSSGTSANSLKRRMTSIGHFSILSETMHNPSICTFVLTLQTPKDDPWTVERFCRLWEQKAEMPRKHPRFHWVADHGGAKRTIQQQQEKRMKKKKHHHASINGYFIPEPSHNVVNSSQQRVPETTDSSAQQRHVRVEHFDTADSSSRPPPPADGVGGVYRHVSETLAPTVPRQDIIQRVQALQTERWNLSDSLWHMNLIPWTKAGSSGTTAPSATATANSIRSGNNRTATTNLSRESSNNAATITTDDEKKSTNNPPSKSSSSRSSSESELGEAIWLFRAHHVLADGASSMFALIEMADEAAEIQAAIATEFTKRGLNPATTPWWKRWFQFFLFFLWLLMGSLPSLYYQCKIILAHWFHRFIYAPNPWNILEQLYYDEQRSHSMGDETEEKVARSASFATAGPVEQAKWVARTLAGRKATVNDVFCAAVSKAVAKQLQWHRERLLGRGTDSAETTENGNNCRKRPFSNDNKLPFLRYTNLAVPVHLKGGVILPGESLSNSIGAFCVRVPCEDVEKEEQQQPQRGKGTTTARDRLQRVHQELNFVKKLPTAFLGHYFAKYSTQILPTSWVSWFFQQAHGGASCVVTNVKGFDRSIHFDGSPVLSMFGFVPIPPGIPIGVVVSSYNEQVHLTVSAQPWAVPDADQFLSWVLEEYVALVEDAAAVSVAAKKNRAKLS